MRGEQEKGGRRRSGTVSILQLIVLAERPNDSVCFDSLPMPLLVRGSRQLFPARRAPISPPRATCSAQNCSKVSHYLMDRAESLASKEPPGLKIIFLKNGKGKKERIKCTTAAVNFVHIMILEIKRDIFIPNCAHQHIVHKCVQINAGHQS